MTEAAAALEASVLSLSLKDFSRQPVLEQAKQKAQLEAAVASAIQPLRPRDRIVLDAPEGLAVALLAGPEDALRVAKRAQAAAGELPVCMALNHGPVKLVANPAGGQEILGDGIAAAVALANLATRGRLMVSRAFRDALTAIAPERSSDLAPLGAFTDSSVRTHELFTLDPRAASLRRRRFLAYGTLAVVALVGVGIGARMAREAANRPAILLFEITPQGDIYVDGELHGKSPPLSNLEVAPGTRMIEVRNGRNPPLRLELRLRPTEEVKVAHAFPVPKKADKGKRPQKDENFIDGLRRRFGN
jgi:class 3 adenylate cyclase